jgi:hypothetical protein
VLIRSGCFGAGFGEGEPLVAEVSDDLQAAAEGRCLRVVMKEECEHRSYAVRDLAALEVDSGAGAAHHDPPP